MGADLKPVQQRIKDYVAIHSASIRAKEAGAGDAAFTFAKDITREALLDCGVDENITEAKVDDLAGSMLRYELFNAWS